MFLLHIEWSSESTLSTASLWKRDRRPWLHIKRTVEGTAATDYWQEAIKRVSYSLGVCVIVLVGERASARPKLASPHQSNVQVKLAAVIWVMPTITRRQGVEQLACQIRATWQLLKEDQLWSVVGSKRWRGCVCVAHGSQSRSCKSALMVLVWSFYALNDHHWLHDKLLNDVMCILHALACDRVT